jgi:HEAT repeat protein
MAEIEAKGLIGFLPYLAPLAASASIDVRETAARTIARLLESDLPACLAFLSLGLGRIVHYETPAADALRGITRDDVWRLKVSAANASACFGLLSFHGNGWVREAALDRLSSITDGKEIPFLLYRSNDWVELVAKKAAALLEERLNTVPVRRFSQHLPILFQLRSRQRGYLSEFQVRLLDRIAREEEIGFLADAAHNAKTVGLRRWILSIAAAAADSRPDTGSFLKELRSDSDPIVRANAWARIWKTPTAAADFRDGLNDSWPAIRRRCLEALCDSNPAIHQSILHTSLFDSSSMVRATARHYLGKIPGADPDQVYRNRLKAGDATPPAALFGISESGHKEDVELLRPFLSASRVSLRRAAVLAIGHLDGAAFGAEIKAALRDKSRGVSKAARLVLEKHSHLLTRDFLLDALSEERPLHVRRGAVRLISSLNKWDRVITLLDALITAPEFNDLIRAEMVRWLQMYNRSFVQPSRDQLAELKRLVGAQSSMLSEELARELSQIANTFPHTPS